MVAGDDAQLVVEFAADHFNLAGVVIEMRLFAGDFEVSGAGEIASDVLLLHDALDGADCLKRRGVHAAGQFASIHRDKFVDAEFESGKHHAAVARTRAPTDSFRFQHDNFRTAFGQRERGGESGKPSADDGNVSTLRQWLRRRAGHLDGGEPVVEFLGHVSL